MKFTENEARTVRLIQEIRKRPSTPERRRKVRSLKRTLLKYRANIRVAAVAQRNGWDEMNRRWRYHALLAVYKADDLPEKPADIERDPGLLALAAAHRMVGKTETRYNDASWLQEMEGDLPHDRLDWMIPGQSYCGFGVIWAYWEGAHLLLPDGTVYTPNVCPWGGTTRDTPISRGTGQGRVRFVRVSPENAKPGALVVMNFGSGGAKHIALARSRMVKGVIPTREFNTTPGAGGNQANGGGCWDRDRARGLIMCTLNVERA